MRPTTPRHQDRSAIGRIALAWLTGSFLTGSFLAGFALLTASPALALSEIGREELPPPAGTPGATPSTPEVPMPGEGAIETPSDAEPNGHDSLARPDIDENGPLPEVIYNLDRLPEPVRRMRDRIVESAKTGDLEKLRPLLGIGNDKTLLTFGEGDGDPVAILKGNSGDGEGLEILAILEEVLNAGFVHLDPGTPEEIYVWPYFFGLPLDKLDAPQRVELFKIVTAGDLEDMKQFGAYIFYRAGITPEGRWAFFVAGE
jgi:hypothetical protein